MRCKRLSSVCWFPVLHQCIRPLVGACGAPGHHGYQRACVLISGQTSSGPFGSPGFACAVKTGPPSRLILSQTSAGMGIAVCYVITLPFWYSSFVRARGAVPSPRPAVAVKRRAQELSRLAASGGHPQGSVLTAPSMVPRLCRLGRCSARPHAFEFALLVENRPCNAGKLVGKRDRQHIVVQSLFGGVNPRFEPIAVPVLDLTSTTQAACTNRARR